MKHIRLLALTGAALLSAGVLTPVRAQDPDDLQRGVARISLMNGEVSVRRGDSGDWVAGVINAPLLTGDQISTGQNSRAEVQFDSANMLRLGGNAEIHMAQLEDRRYQIELAHGTVTFRVLRASDANVEVDTPSVSVRPSKQGSYRIVVKDTGETEVTARAGDVEVFTPRGSQWVYAGQTMLARGTTADPEFQIVAAIAPDDWDRWNDSRDGSLLRSVSPRYVGPGVSGTEDLDANGAWTNDAEYGNVWQPAVAVDPGWAPYQCGRWVWEDWYGWTWVGCEPWGWAPYHYGRWFWRTGFGWGWYPGLIGVRHHWSPALVGFFGFGGGGFGFGFGYGNIGWVPLAPYEMFHPWWGRGYYGGFNRGVNITNVNLYNTYRNARVANGISGVSAADFRAGRFNNVGRFSGSQIGQAGVVRGPMPVTPSSANLRFSDRGVTNAPRSSANTRFFAHQQASPAARVPFAEQQRAMGQSPGATTANRSMAAAPGAGQAAPAQSAARPQEQAQGSAAGGWRRFGEPGANQQAPRTQGAPQSNRGWNGFGNPGSSTGASRQQYSQPQPAYRGNSGSSAPQSLRIAPPVVQQRSSGGGGSYSAPRSYSGGGSVSRPSGGGGGGSSRPSGGGGSSRGGGSHR